jgi:signal transduction histidine kinase
MKRVRLPEPVGAAILVMGLAADVCRRAGLEYELRVPADEELPSRISLALFRIVQEALTNAVKHAQARHVTIEIMRDQRELTLLVSDDGVGVEPQMLRSALSHGILGMRQRVRALAGEFSIRGRPGRGTTIEVRVPLAAGGAKESAPPSA